MRKKSRIGFLIILLLLATLAGCAGDGTDTPTAVALEAAAQPVSTEVPTEAPLATAANPFLRPTGTATLAPPTPTPSATPTQTATPTATPTPSPTVPPSLVELEGAELPPGFSMTLFAEVPQPSSLAFGPDGHLYATSGEGSVYVLPDEDGDGRADETITFTSGFRSPTGIAFHPETGVAYLSSLGRIDILEDTDGNLTANSQENLVRGLPYDWHQNNTPHFGPDGMLYVGLGSTCDVCEEEDERSATILQIDPESGEVEIYASGLRNSYDLAFHPQTGDLFATENGRDDLGEDVPPEELNLIREGAFYGFPDCWGDNSQEGCENARTAVAFFAAHSSANSLVFYTKDTFPPAYRLDDESAVAFVTIFGAWEQPDLPRGIQQVTLTQSDGGYAAEVAWFAQWMGNPLGLAVGPEGELYVGDYARGSVYRIDYGLPPGGSGARDEE